MTGEEMIYSEGKKHKAENKRLKTISRYLVVMLCQKDIEIASLKNISMKFNR